MRKVVRIVCGTFKIKYDISQKNRFSPAAAAVVIANSMQTCTAQYIQKILVLISLAYLVLLIHNVVKFFAKLIVCLILNVLFCYNFQPFNQLILKIKTKNHIKISHITFWKFYKYCIIYNQGVLRRQAKISYSTCGDSEERS